MRYCKPFLPFLLTCSFLPGQDSGPNTASQPELILGELNDIAYYLHSVTRGQKFNSLVFYGLVVAYMRSDQAEENPEGSAAALASEPNAYLVSEPGNNRVHMLNGCDNSIMETFNGPSRINFGSSLAAADLDGNGYDDVLVGARGGLGAGSIAVFRRGPGVVGGTILQTTNGNWATRILVADLDSDGSKEIVVSDHIHDGLAGTSSGWVGIYDAISLQLEVDMEGTTSLGLMGVSMAIASWPGQVNPVLMVGEPGYDSGKGRICILDASLNLIDEIKGSVIEGRLGSGFLGQDPGGNIVIGSPFASPSGPNSWEGNITVYNPSTDAVELSHDGANPGEELGRSIAYRRDGSLLVMRKDSFSSSSLHSLDPQTNELLPLIGPLGGAARISPDPITSFFADGKARYLLAEPNKTGQFGEGANGQVAVIFAEPPDMRVDVTAATRGDTLTYFLDFGPDAAGCIFFPFGSRTGDGPTVIWPGLSVAITIDSLTGRGPALFGTPPTLDANGRGSFTLTVPQGTMLGEDLKIWVSGVLFKNGTLTGGSCTSTWARIQI